jgi:hypothetical protein
MILELHPIMYGSSQKMSSYRHLLLWEVQIYHTLLNIYFGQFKSASYAKKNYTARHIEISVPSFTSISDPDLQPTV